MTSDCIDAALHYGWPLIKLSKPDAPGPSPGKRPLGRNWDTRPGMTADEARAWLAEGGNIGIRTGGALLVVDCDGERPDNLPDTPTVQTGSGGLHLYYRVPDGVTLRTGNTVQWIHPTTDTRGQGGQVVAPGSIHAATGALYEWLPGLSPADITITTLPQWVIDAINRTEAPPWKQTAPVLPAARPVVPAVAITPGLHPFIAGNIRNAVERVLCAPAKTGNEALNIEAYGLGGWLELSEDEIMDALLPAATNGGRRTEMESRATIASGIRGGRLKPRTVPAPLPRETTTAAMVNAALAVPAISPAATTDPDSDYVESPTARPLAEKYLAEKHPTGTLKYWRGDWYRYTGTHFAVYSTEELHRDLSRELSDWHFFDTRGNTAKPIKHAIKDCLLRDVISQLRGLCLIPDRREAPCWIDGLERPPAKDWLALQNGLLSLTLNRDTDPPTREFIPHTPALFNTMALPFSFDAAADSPETWIDFLAKTWPGDAGADAALLLSEWFGFCLSRDMSHHRMLWIIGPTRSGKGLISRILTSLLGDASVCNPTLGSLGDKNGGQVLIGKRLAIIGDARIDKRRNDKSAIIERLLSISGGDAQTFARKYLPDWTGIPDVKFTLLSNDLPPLADESGALLGRLLLLETTKSHLGKEDRFLESRIRRELPGILNWALDGLERLTAQGRFTEPDASRSILAAFRAMSAPLTAFVDECCEIGESMEIECGALYAAYLKWAEDEGIQHPYSRQRFGVSMRSVVPGLTIIRPRNYGGRARYYIGVRAKFESEWSNQNAG